MLGDPTPSPADLHFRLLGVPVRVHPWFWVIALMLGLPSRSDEKAAPVEVLIWVVVVFISILVHEMGHAMLQRRFGGHPRITLYSFGGFAACDDCDRSPRSQILISLAGPAAGFAFAALIVAAIRLAGHEVAFGRFSGFFGKVIPWWSPFPSEKLNIVIFDLLQVNIFWGLINLLPIYPLDGGRVTRELFTLKGSPRAGIVNSLWLSVVTGGLMALYSLSLGVFFNALLFGFLAYGSYQSLRAYQNHYS
jgi:stage IV sporulation protein FB